MTSKATLKEGQFSVRIQGYYKSFKVEFDETDEPLSLDEVKAIIDAMEAAGFKGTTFERRADATDIVGKEGTVSKVEKSKTKNGKDCFIAHISIEGRNDPVSIMFFNAGEARKGDKVKIKAENGYMKFDLVDDEHEEPDF